ALARDAHEKGGFNGAWLYTEHGEIVSKGALGWRDAENKLPMTEDAIFEMASITKMFTATAVMLLVREGKLGLDDEYVKYFPDYPYPGVTLRHLLTHTSGMPDYDVEDLVAPVLEEEKRIPPCGEIIDLMRKSDEEPVGAPGGKFCYSDVGYMLLANAVEKASGVSFEEFMKENVFEPAGMKDSGIYHTRRDGRPSDRFARNMVLEDGSEDSFVPSDICEETAPYVVGSDGMNGCDYLYTTIFDMLAWDRALREEKVLTKEEQQLMYTTVKLNNGEDYADGDGDGYGFGWAINRDPGLGFIVCHSGGMPGLETWFERFVDADRVLVFMSCRDHTDGRAFYGFSQALEDIARDKEPKPITSLDDIVVKDPDESKWESFCGRYEHPEDSDFIIDEVFMKDGELYANAIDDEGDEMSFRLYPIGENEFGRKGGMLDLTFGDGCLMFDGLTCKKL
ncbi:MAG: beta-lactamase family protein, partial [Oscillospiraceae bacterium]|nr:beta-lactamase family protein [Oscillospiraceae bacterium]